jgi:uncharacterized membrane protein YeaQ/YmgE (transglycosylase-associated protein family)
MHVLPWIIAGLVAAWLAGKRTPEPERVRVTADTGQPRR